MLSEENLSILTGPWGFLIGLAVSIASVPVGAYLGHRISINWPSRYRSKIDKKIKELIETTQLYSNGEDVTNVLMELAFCIITTVLMALIIMISLLMLLYSEFRPEDDQKAFAHITVFASYVISFGGFWMVLKHLGRARSIARPHREFRIVTKMLNEHGRAVFSDDEARRRLDLLSELRKELGGNEIKLRGYRTLLGSKR